MHPVNNTSPMRKNGGIIVVIMSTQHFHAPKFQRHADHWKPSIIEATYIQTKLRHDQHLILAGCFSGDDNNVPIVISGDGSLPTSDVMYKTCAMEADMWIWRHVVVVNAQKILVYSADTDIYNIGIAPAKIYPQIHVALSRELRYVHMWKPQMSQDCHGMSNMSHFL